MIAITERQEHVLRLIVDGRSAKEIGDELGISSRTVEQHTDELRRRFGVEKKRDLIPLARAWFQDSEGDPVEVQPTDSRAGSQSALNGPSGSPISPSERAPDSGQE